MLKNRLLGSLAAILLMFGLFEPAVLAQSAPNGGGSGISITPVISQYTLSPGQSTVLKITIKDAAQGAVNAQGSVVDFVSDGASGTPKLLTQPGASSPNSIKSFISNLNNLILQPNEKKDLNVNIKIPQGTPPGAYYGVIRFKAVPVSSTNPANGGQVALTASVASIVLITVPGNLKQQIQLEGIHVYQGSKDGTVFFSKPNKIGIEIRNLGNGFSRPFGNVVVDNSFGKTVGNYQFNNPQQLGNVLPNSTRIFTNNFNKFNKIGKYTITVNVSDSSGQVLVGKKTIWYIPGWIVIIALVVISLLVYLAFRAYRAYKRSNRFRRK